MPATTVRARALREFIDFLRLSDDTRERRPLWFAFMNRLLELARGADRNEILDAFEASHHPVLSLYARLERVVPVLKHTDP
jgi:hypothetical protein